MIAVMLIGWFVFPTNRAHPLRLDFTFPVEALESGLRGVAGIAVADNDQVTLLTPNSDLWFANLDGVLLAHRSLGLPHTASALTHLPGGSALVGDVSGAIYRYTQADARTVRFAEFVDKQAVLGLASDSNGRSFALLPGARALYHVAPSGAAQRYELDSRVDLFTVAGMDYAEGRLFVAATLNCVFFTRAYVLELALDGRLVELWEIGKTPTALSVLELDARGPTVLTANRDATITVWAPQTVGGAPDAPVLPLVGRFDLGESIAAQPSGIDVHHDDGSLIIVTDFGAVVRCDGAGRATPLFRVDSMQGTFEAVALDARGHVRLLASDTHVGAPSVHRYDMTGRLLDRSLLGSPGTVVEGLAISKDGGVVSWATADAGTPKVVTIDPPTAPEVQIRLPDAYTEYAFTGVELAGDEVLLLTDQRPSENGLLAGLLIVWDLDDGKELARFSVAAPNAAGELLGVVHPSDLALAPNGVLYITSDVDDGTVYAFDATAIVD